MKKTTNQMSCSVLKRRRVSWKGIPAKYERLVKYTLKATNQTLLGLTIRERPRLMDLNLTSSVATSKSPLGQPVQHLSSQLNTRVRKIPNSCPWGSCRRSSFLTSVSLLLQPAPQHSWAAGTQPVFFPG